MGMCRDGGAQGPQGLALAILKGLGDTRADRGNLRFLRRAVDTALRDVIVESELKRNDPGILLLRRQRQEALFGNLGIDRFLALPDQLSDVAFVVE